MAITLLKKFKGNVFNFITIYIVFNKMPFYALEYWKTLSII